MPTMLPLKRWTSTSRVAQLTNAQGMVISDVPVIDCEQCGTELVDSHPTVRCPRCKYIAPRAA